MPRPRRPGRWSFSAATCSPAAGPWLDALLEAHPSLRWPRSLSRAEVRHWLARLDDRLQLVALLIYGSGLTLGECLTLRLRDLDPASARLRIADGRRRQRVTWIAFRAGRPLGRQIARVRRRHLEERRRGGGWVLVADPGDARPRKTRRLEWQFLFPAESPPLPAGVVDCRRGLPGHRGRVEARLREGARRAGLGGAVGAPSLRHAFSAHLLEDGVEPEHLRALLGLGRLRLPEKVLARIRSPLDAL
ncbi:MAG: tyrosine-type recombinase/integrase [Acidobacteriota bacterium]|nr:tyrosine-type recombinase/integrase [Acidobacteriota bacterium]